MNEAAVQLRLVFADDGEFHTVQVSVPAARLGEYDRLIDLLREDPDITRQLYVDMKRLVTAMVVEDD